MKEFFDKVAENPQVRAGHIWLTYVVSVLGLPLLAWALMQVYSLQTSKLTKLEVGQQTIVALITSNKEAVLLSQQTNSEQDRRIANVEVRVTKLEDARSGAR